MPVPVLMASHDQRDHVTPHFDHHNLWNTMVPLTSCDTGTKASLDQNVMLHFYCLDIRNVLLPLTVLSALGDANAGASSVT